MQVSSIDLDERNFLAEYVAIMSSIATYLDILQGEENCFLGLILPPITMLGKVLTSLSQDIAKELRDGLLIETGERYFFAPKCFPNVTFHHSLLLDSITALILMIAS